MRAFLTGRLNEMRTGPFQRGRERSGRRAERQKLTDVSSHILLPPPPVCIAL